MKTMKKAPERVLFHVYMGLVHSVQQGGELGAGDGAQRVYLAAVTAGDDAQGGQQINVITGPVGDQIDVGKGAGLFTSSDLLELE